MLPFRKKSGIRLYSLVVVIVITLAQIIIRYLYTQVLGNGDIREATWASEGAGAAVYCVRRLPGIMPESFHR